MCMASFIFQSIYSTYGMAHKKVPVSCFKKSHFSRATETERLEHGTVRSKVN